MALASILPPYRAPHPRQENTGAFPTEIIRTTCSKLSFGSTQIFLFNPRTYLTHVAASFNLLFSFVDTEKKRYAVPICGNG
ncbi:hypothetical protein NPIL_351001 [Nephila pilipes]|uniref:Uncharacterized protein n=1 Tax=Nephila pilipes TaxID=299642 RepID=A0A8X6TJM8_NEPPI|nr:hypothetical protein NPIL_351001 [Nephila pilipes]